MALQDRLDAFKADFVAGKPPYNAPAAIHPVMARATAELIASGQAGRALKAGDKAPSFTLNDPDDWWRIVIGSGLRRTVEALGDETAAKVRARCAEAMQERGIRDVELTSQYMLATKQ